MAGADLVVKMSNHDKDRLLEALSADPAYNLFIISDIENFGVTTDFQDVWADVAEDGRIRGVMLRYYGHFIVSLISECEAAGFLPIVEQSTIEKDTPPPVWKPCAGISFQTGKLLTCSITIPTPDRFTGASDSVTSAGGLARTGNCVHLPQFRPSSSMMQ